MVEPIATGPGFFKLLTFLAGRVRVGGKEQLVSLQTLVDRKFTEVTKTHRDFLKALDRLKVAMKECLDHIQHDNFNEAVLTALETEVESIDKERKLGSEKRREQYEEARVYAERVLNERGILKQVPDDVAEQLVAFMGSY